MVSLIESGTTGSSSLVLAICRILDVDPPAFLEDELARRWREAGSVMRRHDPAAFDALLTVVEMGAANAIARSRG